MGKKSKDKGNRVEREMVHAFRGRGFAAERVPLSGAVRGRFSGDLSVPFLGVDRRVEVKVRAKGYGTVYSQLGDNFALVIKADRREALLVLRLEDGMAVGALAQKAPP